MPGVIIESRNALYIANPALAYCRIRRDSSSQETNNHHPLLLATPLCPVFGSPGLLSIMTQALLRKRDRDLQALPEILDVQEQKRFHGGETDEFLHLLQLDQTLAEDDEEDEFSPSEELVKGVMRSLQEEMAVTYSTSYAFLNSGFNSAATNISSDHIEGPTRDTDSDVDLCYLLEASDDDLGIPLSTAGDITEEYCQYSQETCEGLPGNPNLKSLCEKWHFEDNLQNYQQFEFYDHALDEAHHEDHLNRDFVSQIVLFGGEFFGGEFFSFA